MVRAQALCDFVFIACAPLEQAHRCNAGKQPGEFRDFGYIGLSPEDGFLWVESEGEIIESDVKGVLVGGGGAACESVVIGNEVKCFVLGLELEVLAHSSEEVAYVELA